MNFPRSVTQFSMGLAVGVPAGRRVAADPEARQRAEDRAHNAAILGQMPDEDVARGLAEAESWQGVRSDMLS